MSQRFCLSLNIYFYFLCFKLCFHLYKVLMKRSCVKGDMAVLWLPCIVSISSVLSVCWLLRLRIVCSGVTEFPLTLLFSLVLYLTTVVQNSAGSKCILHLDRTMPKVISTPTHTELRWCFGVKFLDLYQSVEVFNNNDLTFLLDVFSTNSY